uniref:Ion transport domain-containing protein n=2 Tax=Hemiselmis andersenii TaxID=464988 RepID=A0A7S1EGL2_HEMAN
MAPIFFISFTLVCSNIMLNLFIGMILDNFSFITDEVAQQEDDNWTEGASSEQLAAMTRSFKLFDRGTTYIPISSVISLMQVMYKPLGFVDPVTLSVDTTHSAKAAYQLVRAELNLILQAEWDERKRIQKKGFLRRLMAFEVLPRYKTRFAMCIAYEDLMKVLLYWRKPDMVPYNLKVERHDRIKQTLRMNAALTISDFFRGTVARRKREKMQGYLRKRVEFSTWQAEDAHRVRRMGIVAQVRAENKRILAERGNKSHGMEMRLPSEKDFVNMDKIDFVPPIMQSHRELLESLKHEHLKPMHGVDAFLQHSQHRIVVIKFLDPHNARQMPLCLVDFTEADWMGWVVRNTSHDTFFEPMRFQESGPKGIDWIQIEMIRKVGKSGRRQRVLDFGSLVDMTSCVELRTENKTREELEAEGLVDEEDDDPYDSDEEVTKKKNVIVMESGKNAKRARRERELKEKESLMERFKKTVPVSVLRINLGLMEHDEEKHTEMTTSEEIRRGVEITDDFREGCAEVLGYMPPDFVMPLPGAENPFRNKMLQHRGSTFGHMDVVMEEMKEMRKGDSMDSMDALNQLAAAAQGQNDGGKAPSFLLGGYDGVGGTPRQGSDDEEDVEELLQEMMEEEARDKRTVSFDTKEDAPPKPVG